VNDIKKKLCFHVKQSIEQLAESGLDFTSKEILVNDKTIG